MKINKRIEDKLHEAASHGRCLYVASHADQEILYRLTRSGQVIRARRGLYVLQDVWRDLSMQQQYAWIIRGLHAWRPELIFAGLSVIALYDIEYPFWLNEQQTIFLASTKAIGVAKTSKTRYVHVTPSETLFDKDRSMTSVTQALLDCAARFEFHEVLPMIDSALRKRLTTKSALTQISKAVPAVETRIGVLLRYADPRSENGGESLCRAIIIEEGFPAPELQQEFRMQDGRRYRVDGLYRLANGKAVVVEYDGMNKYTDDTMTGGQSIRQVVHAEKQREQDLLNSGVSQIVRFDYKDILQRDTVTKKLIEAGVPRIADRTTFWNR